MLVFSLFVIVVLCYVFFGYTPYHWLRSLFPQNPDIDAGHDSGPTYTPEEWNVPGLQEVSNCYSYALDDVNRGKSDKHQPGMVHSSTYSPEPYRASDLTARVLADNRVVSVADVTDVPPDGFYRIVLFVSFTDYHFMRQDNDGYWSHKPGRRMAKNTDWSGELITDPLSCNTGPYFAYINCFHVPNNRTAETKSKGRVRRT